MQTPTLGRIVLVQTPEPIGGQLEHAAIVTQVWDRDMVDVTVLPGDGDPMPWPRIYPLGHPYAGPVTWRWPDRVAA